VSQEPYLESGSSSDTSESYNTRVTRLTKKIKNLAVSRSKNPIAGNTNKIDIINKKQENFRGYSGRSFSDKEIVKENM
jgi:hypothetical protein